MTTIDDVASAALVSKSTVSRAFARPASVREETLQRVLQVADSLGYQPNLTARSLARGRTGNIALFVPDINNPFFPPLIKAVQSTAALADLSLLVVDSDAHAEDDWAKARKLAAQVDGIVLFGPRLSDARLAELALQTPTVLVNHEAPGLASVILSTEHGARQVVEHLVALGHRHLAYLAGRDDNYSNLNRRAAIVEACRNEGCDLSVIGPAEPVYESGVRAADLVLARGATAVLAFNDFMAMGCMHRLSDRGKTIGEDVSVVGFDDTWLASTIRPALSTVRVPVAAAGAVALRLLTDLINNPSAAPTITRLAGDLIVRASTGPARAEP